MAHLANDLLPESFDVIVDGTGLTLSVLAGALARTGRSVLHLDRCGYYGELWATLLHRDFEEWLLEHTSGKVTDEVPLGPIPELEGKRALVIKETPKCISNVVDFIPQMVKTAPKDTIQAAPEHNAQATQPSDQNVPAQATTQSAQSPALSNPCASTEQEGDKSTASLDVQGVATSAVEGEEAPKKEDTPAPKTWQSLDKRWFNYDLMPKPLYCRGDLINSLTETNIGRYLEFRAISKLFTRTGDKIEQVPCSREDVFNTKAISMVEKRKLMKFLTFCMDFEKHPEEYQAHESTPYSEYLRLKDHTPNLIQYIVHTIAMVDDSATTMEGLRSTQMFIKSLGRFGNAPFLFPIYGSGELPQSFCRFSAVWGSVYCLKRYVQAVVLEEENKLVGVVCSSGQKITCKAVVMSARAMRSTADLHGRLRTKKLSRAIFITDGPLESTEGAMTIVTIPPLSLCPSQTKPFRLLQLDPLSSCTMGGTYMIHVTVEAIQNTARDDLHVIAKTFFNIQGHDDCNKAGPNLLRAIYFNVDTFRVEQPLVPSLDLPKALHLVSDPDDCISYESAMNEAKEVFHQLCPGESFLPATPNPEDIIYEDTSSPEQPADNGGAPKPVGESPLNPVSAQPANGESPQIPLSEPQPTATVAIVEYAELSHNTDDGCCDNTSGASTPTL